MQATRVHALRHRLLRVASATRTSATAAPCRLEASSRAASVLAPGGASVAPPGAASGRKVASLVGPVRGERGREGVSLPAVVLPGRLVPVVARE